MFNRRNFLLRNLRHLGLGLAERLRQISYGVELSYFLNEQAGALRFPNRYAMYDHVCQAQQLSGEALQYLEFGVFRGDSIKYWAEHNENTSSCFYGFDSFEGLPETWYPGMDKGAFSVGGDPPETSDGRVHFVKGWFERTLPGFIETLPSDFDGITIIHLDADLYSSTYFVLNCLYFQNRIQPGTILIFDEVVLASVAHTEFRAFIDFVRALAIRYEVLAIGHFEMAIRIVDLAV